MSRQQAFRESLRKIGATKFKGSFLTAYLQLTRQFLLAVMDYVQKRLPEGNTWEPDTTAISRPFLKKPGHFIVFEMEDSIPFRVQVNVDGQRFAVSAYTAESTGDFILKRLTQGSSR